MIKIKMPTLRGRSKVGFQSKGEAKLLGEVRQVGFLCFYSI